MNDIDYDEMLTYFTNFDSNNNGMLEFSEFAELIRSLGEIFAKISAHFALEEKEMRELKYDHYEDHKQDHEQLLDDIRDIMDEYEDMSTLDEKEFGQRLTDWFSQPFQYKRCATSWVFASLIFFQLYRR